ncbi:MAG: hypothetical protein ABJF10_03725 [Chthoniobacter sp.]|uniref:hypothetical protein n=1 Tax=Chthoniobacter sp. TaxID=2510640 RepID=UPI0032A9AD25
MNPHDAAVSPETCAARSTAQRPGSQKNKFLAVGVAALAAAIWPVTACATPQLLAYESYNYTPGNAFGLAVTPTTAMGFNGNFEFLGEDLNIAPGASTISAGSLSYTDGNSLSLGTSNNQYNNGHGRLLESFDTTGAGGFAPYLEGSNIGANGTTLYISFLLRVASPTGGYNGFELFRGTSADSGRILSVNQYTGHGSANYYLTVGEGANSNVFGGTPTTDANLGFTNTNVNLFVLRIDFGVGGTDTVSIYANPLLGTEPGSPLGQVTASDLSFDRISNSTFSGGAVQMLDEVRVGTTFASVTPAPEPGATVLLGGVAVVLLGGMRRRCAVG